MKTTQAARALWILPAALLVLSALTTSLRGPFFWGQNLDPEYCYLLNAVNLLTFQAPGHTDHPGTTLQELGALVVFLRWWGGGLLTSWQPVDTAALSRPEDYLHAIHVALNLLFCGLLAASGREIYRVTGRLAPALVFQASFLLFDEILVAQTRVSPEPLLMSAALAMIWPLIPVALGSRTEAEGARPVRAILAGAAFGFGAVAKVTFLPLGLFALVLPGWKQRLRFAGAAAVSAALFLAPIWGQLPRVVNWIWSLAVHKDRYGQGERGLPSLAALIDNAYKLYQEEPYLYYFTAFYALALILTVWRGESADGRYQSLQRLLAGAVAAIGLSLAVTAKHYASHYALPAMLAAPAANAALADSFLGPPGRSARRRTLAAVFALLMLLGLAWSARRFPVWLSAMLEIRTERIRQQAYLDSRPDCVAIGVYRSSLPRFALHFGNSSARHRHNDVLDSLYPDTIHFQLFSPSGLRFEDFRFQNRDAEVARMVEEGRCVLVQGERESVGKIEGFEYETAVPGGREVIVRLVRVKPRT